MQHVYCKNCGREEDFHPENKVAIENGQAVFFCREKCKWTYFEQKKYDDLLKKRREKCS